MSLATFPTLSRGPIWPGYEFGTILDPTLRNDASDGKPQYRDLGYPRLRWWRIQYHGLTVADYNLLYTFETETVRYGGAAFNYTHPWLSTVVIVRFGDKLDWVARSPDQFNVKIYLIEDPNDYDE